MMWNAPEIAFVGPETACPEILKKQVRIFSDLDEVHAANLDWAFFWQEGCLVLDQLSEKSALGLCIDFANKALAHRTKHFAPGKEMLCKAVAGKKTSGEEQQLKVLDATAGLGRDSFILANAGHQVTLFERSPYVAALLSDGLRRLQLQESELANQMQLTYGDFLSQAQNSGESWDVVYLDPMFPERKKSALVKKEMRIFKAIVGGDPDADLLLAKAFSLATKKVVVKRPKNAPFLDNKKPSHQLQGKTGRFDVYAV